MSEETPSTSLDDEPLHFHQADDDSNSGSHNRKKNPNNTILRKSFGEEDKKSLLELMRDNLWPEAFYRLNTSKGKKEACERIGSKGWSPIHAAIYFSATLDIILQLLEINPNCVFETTNDGRHALHFACHFKSNESTEIIELLYSRFPDAIK